MTMVPLRDVVAEAHRALEAGDYHVARAACQHVLEHYPSFADMHRLQGEILLEQGETDGARQCFEQALALDPQNVLATLGLGVIAEESLDLAGAAGYFQRALEIDPGLTQLRDELVRLYSKLYGQGGRLHVSGAGLAAIYARGNQLTLAQRQYEAVLAHYPDRLDLVLALAEVAWRAGDVAATQRLCQQVLATRPQTARALYLQADLYRRHGLAERAAELFTAAAAIDPVGDLARALEQANPTCSFAGVLPEAVVPAFDPASVPATAAPTTNSSLGVTAPPVEESEWQRITTELNASVLATAEPAAPPDDGYHWPWEEAGAAQPPAAAAVATTAPDAGQPGDTGEAALAALMTDWERTAEEVAAATPGTPTTRGYTDTLREFDALGFKPFDVDAPAGAADDGLPVAPSLLAETEAAPSTAPSAAAPEAAGVSDVEAALQELVGNWDAIDEELRRATPDAPAAGVTDLAAQLGIEGVTPFTAEPDPALAAESLGAGWADLDKALSTAIPADALPRGFTRELEALDAEGLEPFDFADLDAGLEALAESAPGRAAPPPEPAPAEPLPDLDRTWADLEAELAAATPQTASLPRGFTAELRSLDAQGLTPFLPDDLAGEGADAPVSAAPAPVPDAAAALDLEAALGLEPLPSVPPVAPAAPEDVAAPAISALPAALADPPPVPADAAPPPAPDVGRISPPAPFAPRPVTPLSPIRPAPFGSTISLSGSLFDQLRARKEALVSSGAVVIRRAAPPTAPPAAAAANLAVREAEAASDALPADPVARRRLADAYAASGQPAEAAMSYRLLLRADPAMVGALAAPVEELAAAYPAEPAVLRLLGELYLRQGRYNQAMAVYRSLLLAGAPA
jgi:tetratricopeptide (TPR) repeat protein